MKNTKVKTKLLISFTLVIALALLTGVIGMTMTNMISEQAEELYDKHVLGLEKLTAARQFFTEMRINLNRMSYFAVQQNVPEVKDQEESFFANIAAFDSSLTEYGQIITSDALIREFNKMDQLKTEYMEVYGEYAAALDTGILTIAETGDFNVIDNALVFMSDMSHRVEAWMESIVTMTQAEALAADRQSVLLSEISTTVQIIMLVLMIALSFCVAILISRGIEKNLRKIIEKLTLSSNTISSSATQISSGSENLAEGASSQAASIEETSASVNEAASMIAQNAENTQVASQIASDTMNMANTGMKEMQTMIQSMEEIKESSDKISNIIKTIDDIALQTNLLAINATIEAARAGGEAGRSFSVVAGEVRELALKSADAAKDTSDIIEKNILLTKSGEDISRGVASSLEKITEKANRLDTLITEITKASQEQAVGIKQINIAISQMEKVTQENAAVAEENAAASNSMRDEIANLEDAVKIATTLIENVKNNNSPANKNGGRKQENKSALHDAYLKKTAL